MICEPAPSYVHAAARRRTMLRERDGWLWGPGPEPDTAICRTHADTRPHDYLLREQADGVVTCSCPDYARSGHLRICKHAWAVYDHGSMAALLAAREVTR